jgi:aconitase A
MLAAGLLAKKSVQLGLSVKPWVKTSLAPGSQVVMDYYAAAGLIAPLEELGFNLVGFGCTTCIGNSGPLPPEVAQASPRAAWRWRRSCPGDRLEWEPESTYVRRPPFVSDVTASPQPPAARIADARVLAHLGDSVTTDHISPAGAISPDSPAGRWLLEHGVPSREFNSYGARRGNHEVMIRGTFANGRIRNRLAGGAEGGVTTHLPSGELVSIYDAAVRYREEHVPLVVLAGKEYGSGSSRDWAAKGTALLGVRAVLVEAEVRIDTAMELDHYRHGGILPYVLRSLTQGTDA